MGGSASSENGMIMNKVGIPAVAQRGVNFLLNSSGNTMFDVISAEDALIKSLIQLAQKRQSCREAELFLSTEYPELRELFQCRNIADDAEARTLQSITSVLRTEYVPLLESVRLREIDVQKALKTLKNQKDSVNKAENQLKRVSMGKDQSKIESAKQDLEAKSNLLSRLEQSTQAMIKDAVVYKTIFIEKASQCLVRGYGDHSRLNLNASTDACAITAENAVRVAEHQPSPDASALPRVHKLLKEWVIAERDYAKRLGSVQSCLQRVSTDWARWAGQQTGKAVGYGLAISQFYKCLDKDFNDVSGTHKVWFKSVDEVMTEVNHAVRAANDQREAAKRSAILQERANQASASPSTPIDLQQAQELEATLARVRTEKEMALAALLLSVVSNGQTTVLKAFQCYHRRVCAQVESLGVAIENCVGGPDEQPVAIAVPAEVGAVGGGDVESPAIPSAPPLEDDDGGYVAVAKVVAEDPDAVYPSELVWGSAGRVEAQQEEVKLLKKIPSFKNETYVPERFCDPITLEIMEDPVVCVSGHTYERRTIEEWFSNHNTDPLTNLELPHKMLFPNHVLRCEITEFLEKPNAETNSTATQ